MQEKENTSFINKDIRKALSGAFAEKGLAFLEEREFRDAVNDRAPAVCMGLRAAAAIVNSCIAGNRAVGLDEDGGFVLAVFKSDSPIIPDDSISIGSRDGSCSIRLLSAERVSLTSIVKAADDCCAQRDCEIFCDRVNNLREFMEGNMDAGRRESAALKGYSMELDMLERRMVSAGEWDFAEGCLKDCLTGGLFDDIRGLPENLVPSCIEALGEGIDRAADEAMEKEKGDSLPYTYRATYAREDAIMSILAYMYENLSEKDWSLYALADFFALYKDGGQEDNQLIGYMEQHPDILAAVYWNRFCEEAFGFVLDPPDDERDETIKIRTMNQIFTDISERLSLLIRSLESQETTAS